MEQLSEGVLPLSAQLQNQEETREQSGRFLAHILREVNFTKAIQKDNVKWREAFAR